MGYGTAVILSGGSGSRMGGVDKGLLAIAGKGLAERLFDALSPHFGEVLVSTNRPEAYGRLEAACVRDRFPGRGPLAGIHAALKATASDWVFVIACDMPAFSPGYAVRMREAIDAAERRGERPLACVTRSGPHVEPFHAFYSRGLLEPLGRVLAASADGAGGGTGGLSIAGFLSRHEILRVPKAEARAFTPDWGLFSNLNTPEDLERRLGVAVAGSP